MAIEVNHDSSMKKISSRLESLIEALPIENGMRILEIGCGPGVMARAIANAFERVSILAIDRSPKAIALAQKSAPELISTGRLFFQQIEIEEFELKPNDLPFDLAFAIRVGVLDGRHPDKEALALARIANALTHEGRLFVDGGAPLIEVSLENVRKSH
jgi:ubiquinone/menaquinone biosynthesis C-methylase UbiE